MSSLKDFRRNIILEMFNDAGQIVLRYNIYNCWVSEFQAVPELDANANAFAIESIKLENEGWERDEELEQPEEIMFDEPPL